MKTKLKINKDKLEIISNFENTVAQSFFHDITNKKILMAVSGGADSVAMLICCKHLQEKYNLQLSVVTVNHRIRKEKESAGDAIFVQNLCKINDIECFVVSANVGQIQQLAEKRKKGIEEAARVFRYDEFLRIANEIKADYVFLAHNQDDQIETLFQRFLQGSFGMGCCGIPKYRNPFFRPLLDITKDQIKKYLKIQKITYRTDKTNNDNKYFRNKLRNVIIPKINQLVPGWQSSVLHGKNKKQVDEDYFENFLSDYHWCNDNNVLSIKKSVFNKLELAIRIRLVYIALNQLSANDRIPYELIYKFCIGKDICVQGIQMQYLKEEVLIKYIEKTSTESFFFAIIDRVGDYFITNTRIIVSEKKNNAVSKEYTLPFLCEVRNKKVQIEQIPSCSEKKVFVELKGK